MKPVYVDDDEYWKTGYYYNPNDNHILVKNRMFDGNYSFNLANPKARFICGGLYIVIKAAVVYQFLLLRSCSASLFIQSIHVDVLCVLLLH